MEPTTSNDPFAFMLGPLFDEQKVIDAFGGKLVFRNKKELLMTVPVTKLINNTRPLKEFVLKHVQRDIDHERVEKISLMQREEYKRSGIYPIASTIIILGKCPQAVTEHNPFGLRIVDGQHRRGAWVDINTYDPTSCAGQLTLVKICSYTTLIEMEEDFRIINDNWVPVNKYHLKVIVKDVVDGVVEWMKKTYSKSFFRPTEKPQRPHINLIQVCHALAENDRVLSLIDSTDNDILRIIKIICNRITKYNQILEDRIDEPSIFREKNESMKKILQRIDKCLAADQPCFLGMESNCEWVGHALEIKDKPSTEEETDEEETETEEEETETEEEEESIKIKPKIKILADQGEEIKPRKLIKH